MRTEVRLKHSAGMEKLMTARSSKTGIGFLVTLLALTASLIAQSPTGAPVSTPVVEIPGTQPRTLASSIDGQEYKIPRTEVQKLKSSIDGMRQRVRGFLPGCSSM
jgi:hypothetical protein